MRYVLTGLVCGAEEDLVAEVLGGVLVGVPCDERLHQRHHLFVGEVIVEAIGGEDEELVSWPEAVVPEERLASNVRGGPDVVHLENLQEGIVPPRLQQQNFSGSIMISYKHMCV